MRYYISDLHFFHDALNSSMDNRGFESVEAMNAYMIEQWNKKVRKNDETVILGDFSVGKAPETMEVLKALNGAKYLIVGNHDAFLEDKAFDRSLFKWIDNYRELKDNRRRVVMSHYPMMCYNGQFWTDKEGKAKTYMLYGHVHNTLDERLVNRFQNITRQSIHYDNRKEESRLIPCNMINCFCGFSDYMPLTLDEWIETDTKRRAALNENGE